MPTTKKKKARFRLGDWVMFLYGVENLFAQVIEVMGPIGVNGRYIYRIRPAQDIDNTDAFAMPEDEMEAVPSPDKDTIINYLKEGGLVEILRANLGIGPEHPKVWLTYKRRGALTYTLQAERGVIGGAVVPFFALHEKSVFTGMQEQVAAFLTSFGLSRTEAEAVLAAVGTAP